MSNGEAIKVLLVGCGKMGGALLESWRKGDEGFTIVDPALESAPEGVMLVSSRDEIADERFDVIVVAIKPQMIPDVMPDYQTMLAEDGYVLSIAAGASIERLMAACGSAHVVRVMPNLPAAIGQGVSGLCASAEASEGQIDHAKDMMGRAGNVIEVDDEDALDHFTAVAGSGPGYVFEIARTYAEAAKAQGFSEEQSVAMVLGVLQGTIAMALESDQPLAELRNSVTSKGGTTAAGLSALNGDGQLGKLMHETLQAAYARAVELR